MSLILAAVFLSLSVFAQVESTTTTTVTSTTVPVVDREVVMPKGSLVSKATAQVGSQVLTSREVQIFAVLEELHSLPGNVDGFKTLREKWKIEPGSDEFRKQVGRAILEMVLNLEAENFSVGDVGADEARDFRVRAQDRLKDWSYWKKLEVSEAELERMIQRKLRSKKFIRFKTETAGIQISESEMKDYYEKNRVRFGNRPFEQFKESIRQFLSQRALEESLKDWFEVLKRKYKVRVLE